MKQILFSALSVLLLASCSTRIGDFTLISTKNVDMNRANGYYVAENKRVEGKDEADIIVFIPTRTINMKQAVDNAIENAGTGCVALADVVIDTETWWIPYIYGKSRCVVKGNPVYKR